MRRVWLVSMDSAVFDQPPLTTARLKAHHLARGATAATTRIDLVHVRRPEALWRWLRQHEPDAAGGDDRPVLGFSCYVWNAALFDAVMRHVRRRWPHCLVVAGGPHAQDPARFLFDGRCDAVVLGEGELTFSALLDAGDDLDGVAGLALPDVASVSGWRRTQPRAAVAVLDDLPSPLDVLSDEDLCRPQASLETTRGCPYGCAFCEWGTGDVGTRVRRFGRDRVEGELGRLVAAGVDEVFLCDANFGAFREDRHTADVVLALRAATGRPLRFGTSWSKKHNERVIRIVRDLHRAGLLEHHTLALQTLTGEALRRSRRTNMAVNDFEGVARRLAEEGVPVTTELIWGLPGDTLAGFQRGVDRLAATFPSITIYGFALLPGTHFYEHREQYGIETTALPTLRGMGGVDYVVATDTFDREEGVAGYRLVTAYSVLDRGNVTPFVSRAIALLGGSPTAFLLAALDALVNELKLPGADGLELYANRLEVYEALLAEPESLASTLGAVLESHCIRTGLPAELLAELLVVDLMLAPTLREPRRRRRPRLDVEAAVHELTRMRLPPLNLSTRPARGPAVTRRAAVSP